MDICSVFSHVSDGGLESLEGNHDFRLNFDSLLIVRLVPDLIHLVELVDLFVKIGTREPVWPGPVVRILLVFGV